MHFILLWNTDLCLKEYPLILDLYEQTFLYIKIDQLFGLVDALIIVLSFFSSLTKFAELHLVVMASLTCQYVQSEKTCKLSSLVGGCWAWLQEGQERRSSGKKSQNLKIVVYSYKRPLPSSDSTYKPMAQGHGRPTWLLAYALRSLLKWNNQYFSIYCIYIVFI